ncbi:MAG: hypothetical protein Q9187_004313, partial [Circinaria calcarea]
MTLLRLPVRAIRTPFLTRPLSTSTSLLSTPGWDGSGRSDHVTNRKDTLDVHSSSSKAGKQARVEDSPNSSATSGKDERNDNARAQKDHPESPVVIGMNDERGG